MDRNKDVSRGALLPVNRYGVPNSYPKLIKNKNLNELNLNLNELSPYTMSNTNDKCITITFFIVNNPYPCHPYMFITENCCLKFTIMSFWAPALNSPS